MEYRHEYKYEINYLDVLVLRSRLAAVMKRDEHSEGGIYKVRSLYFDTPQDKALYEKIDGVNRREKFRLRRYNDDTSFIRLEKKSKINGLCKKDSCAIFWDVARCIISGDVTDLESSGSELLREFCIKKKTELLTPKTIVSYTREAFVYEPGNVRVTLDYDIRTSDFRTDFLANDTVALPAGEPVYILEVKWDEYLPDIIKDVISLSSRRIGAFSKYEKCRIYG